MEKAIKTHEQHTITHGSYMVVASFDLTGEKVRITLTKPDSFGNNAKARDYHFEQSNLEAVEGFAKCAQKAVDIARQLEVANRKTVAPKTKKR